MTQANNFAPNEYTASASQTTFAVTFDYTTADDLVVYVDDVASSSWGLESGSVVFETPLAGGENVFITRLTDRTQDLEFAVGGRFPASSNEAALDKIVRMIQDLAQALKGVPTLSARIAELIGPLVLPEPTPLGFWQWNADGTEIDFPLGGINTTDPDPDSQLVFASNVVEITPTNNAIQYSATDFVPAGLILLGVVAYVKTTLGNGNSLTTWSLGTEADPTKFAAGVARTATTQTNVGTFLGFSGGTPLPSALTIVVSATSGSFDGTGVIVLTYSGYSITPATEA